MTLHLIIRTPHSSGIFADLLDAFADGDYLLLIEDGCYAALPGAAGLDDAVVAGRIGVLREDAESRGLLARVAPSIEIVDMDGFVALTERFPKSLSWF
ncbi:sulfurtransferase complex subunit TusB [Salinicola halophilus]|uniref:sulfurtransferase complex subunit TusB n=1 Tax=Salinicola halophilus TaxID=184065 RepID=UPI000DA20609|nr:sulfurtransferase complex subunit TusB [Salinicola halophilus]